jgi:hypothetical protein
MSTTYLFVVFGIAMGWTAENSGFESQHRQEISLLFVSSRPALGPKQNTAQCVRWLLSQGVNLMGREDIESPLSSAEVKNAWSYASTRPYDFMT